MDLISTIVLVVVLAMVGAIASSVVVDEFNDAVRKFADWILLRASLRLPIETRSEFVSELRADVDRIRGPISKLYNALGAFRAARQLCEDQKSHEDISSANGKLIASDNHLKVYADKDSFNFIGNKDLFQNLGNNHARVKISHDLLEKLKKFAKENAKYN